MLYQEYEKKMMKLVRILGVIRKFRFLIISLSLAVVFMVGAFLITKGMVISKGPSEITVEYGESVEIKANAVIRTSNQTS